MNIFQIGQRVRLNADTADWGRVVGKATVLFIYPDEKIQVDSDDLRAIVTVEKSEVYIPGIWKG